MPVPTRYAQVVRNGAASTIHLNRTRAHNRINAALAADLAKVCAELDADPTVRVVIVTGRGAHFSAGYERPSEGQPLVRAASAVAAVRKPVIAAINGDCLDQGLELALACDLRIAVRGVRLGVRQLAQGLMPWDGGTQRLPRLIGRAQALRLLMTAESITSDEALRIGLVHQVAGEGELEHDTDELVHRIVDGASVAAAYAKEAVTAGMDMTLAQGLRLEADLSIMLQSTDDRREGVRSFLERRQPRFQGQ